MSISEQTAALLGEDLVLWQTMAQDLKTGGHLAPFQPDSNNAWAGLDQEQKTERMIDMAMLHGQVFGYEVYAPDVYSLDEKFRSPGYYCYHSVNHHLERGEEIISDGALSIPDMPEGQQSLQFLFFGTAGSLLHSRVERFLQDLGARPVDHANDIMDFHVHHGAGNPFIEEMILMLQFPMADDFEGWLNLPSNRYAMAVTEVMNQEVFGKADIDPAVLKVFKAEFIEAQYGYLTLVLDDKSTFFTKQDHTFRRKWEERAQKYITEAFKSPEDYNMKNAIEMIDILRRNKIDFTPPQNLKDVLDSNQVPKKRIILTREEALKFVGDNLSSTFEKMSTEDIMHVIEMIGPQKHLSKKERKLSDVSVQELLNAMPLSESFLDHYRVVMYEMARDLRKDFVLNTLGKEWLKGQSFFFRTDFINILNEKIARHFDIEPVSVLLYSEGKMERQRGDMGIEKDAIGFASPFADSHHIRARYGLELPQELEGKPIIGLNKHPDFGLLTGPTPMPLSMVLAHEYGHHVVDRLKRAELPETDPRYEQQQQYKYLEKNGWLDRRLRDEFSMRVYPLIQTEKFEYWLMDEFERYKPFAFLDPK